MATSDSVTRILPAALAALLVLAPARAEAEIRIGNLSVFLNDLDVTVHTIVLGAIPPSLHESLHSGILVHVRFNIELRHQRTLLLDPVIQARTVERQLGYNVLTKEYKVVSLAGEQREAFLTKNLREAQRVISELRVVKLAVASVLDANELYYVRVRADVSLGGDNSWFARMAGDAAETPWVQSSLLTVTRSQ